MYRQVLSKSWDTKLIEILLNFCGRQLDYKISMLIVNNVWKKQQKPISDFQSLRKTFIVSD